MKALKRNCLRINNILWLRFHLHWNNVTTFNYILNFMENVLILRITSDTYAFKWNIALLSVFFLGCKLFTRYSVTHTTISTSSQFPSNLIRLENQACQKPLGVVHTQLYKTLQPVREVHSI